MRKNGTRTISLGQYRLTDLFLFAVILIVFEVIIHYASVGMIGLKSAPFTPMVAIVLTVMMRWGWPGVFFAVGDSVVLCLLGRAAWQDYIIYCVGNAFIVFLLIFMKLVDKQKISGKWYFTALFVFLGWLLPTAGKIILMLCFGLPFYAAFQVQVHDLVSLGICLVIVLVLRKLDGMFEDQKHYLLRLEKERKEKARRDEFGDEYLELDEDEISSLRKWDEE